MAKKKTTKTDTSAVLTQEEKRDAIKALLQANNKQMNNSMAMGFADELDLSYSFMKPPIIAIQSLLSSSDGSPGGFPYGKFTIITGPEKTGKTTLCLQTIAHEMRLKQDGFYVWVDAENSLDYEYAKTLGIDFSRLVIIKHGLMHELLNQLIDLSKEGLISGIIIDSVGGLTPKEEIESSKGEVHGVEKDHMLNLQRKLGQFFRMVNPFAARHNIAVVLITHVYQDPNNNGAYVTKGGNALKHWGHIRLMLKRENDASTVRKLVMPDGETRDVFIGHNVIVKLDKTRQNSNESKTVVIPFRYGIGLDSLESAVSIAINLGIIEQAGAWFKYKEEKFQGRSRLSEYIKSPEVYEELLNNISVYLESNKESNEEVIVESETENEIELI